MAAAHRNLPDSTVGGGGGGGKETPSLALVVSVAALPPPPSIPSFKPPVAVMTRNHNSTQKTLDLVRKNSPIPSPSLEKLIPPETLAPPPDMLDPPNGNHSLSSSRGEIVRCDIMWSASSANHCELFTPVQSCDIQPIVIVRDADLRMIFDDDDIEERKSNLKIHYRWRRGPARAVCFFHPHRVANIQCRATLRCFCSNDCFRRGFKQVRRFYTSLGKLQIPRQINQFSYGVPCKTPVPYEALREPDWAHHRLLRQAGLVVDPEKEEWTVVSYARNFAPSKDDVGHQLKFECVVCGDAEYDTGLEPNAPAAKVSPPATASRPSGAVSAESFASGTQLVRVVTSAGDGMSSTSDKKLQNGDNGPRSSPVNLMRKATSTGNNEEARWTTEELFWGKWDLTYALQSNHPPDTATYKSVTTSCVVPQAPLVETRPIASVGILAFISGAQPSVQPRQRIVPPGSPLAKALGIGLCQARGFNRRRNKTGDPVWTALSARVAQQRNPHTPSIREQREDVLTDKLFASWGGKASIPAPSPDIPERVSGKQQPARAVLPTFNMSVTIENSDAFTVMTWNVLADIYATMDAYPYCEPYVLAWSYRRDRILAEVLAYRPDIICLQEVQADHFEDFFAPALLRRGYEGLYKQKTSKVFRGSGKHRGGRYICDGCATFFKAPKFRLVDHFGIEFARVAPPTARVPEKTDKRLNKDNVALVLCLEQMTTTTGSRVSSGPAKMKQAASQNRGRSDGTNDNGHTSAQGSTAISTMVNNPNATTAAATSVRTLVVANTHILANPEAPDVKIWQANTLTSVLTEYMEKTMMTYARMDGSGRMPGLVVCGDFNSTPDSAVYQLVTAGACDARHEELQSSDVYKWLHDIRLGHGLNLRSSYGAAAYIRAEADRVFPSSSSANTTGAGGAVQGSNNGNFVMSHALYEPEFTNYTNSYVGCLDYIFFDDRSLKVTGTLELLQELTLMEEAYRLQLTDWALPSPQRSSDHTALLSRFEWTR
eukprot:Gregarina_sp_Poly_1__5053@NODE_267_length_10370_cov_226_463457_g233_i0_p1_GENE_NODE_267_length_10370_cov_226_463457_g233_i0NODE_267_length_10370_cov_226_463457_g233_i0_p1_ORF_typecomplete_len998_score142_53Exo_endo_phos/PF03372_23/8_1e03Exo_endo_phos/PF03372_23/6_6e45_NODE_267_length_10370_cov_226_463457_g233_i024835476